MEIVIDDYEFSIVCNNLYKIKNKLKKHKDVVSTMYNVIISDPYYEIDIRNITLYVTVIYKNNVKLHETSAITKIEKYLSDIYFKTGISVAVKEYYASVFNDFNLRKNPDIKLELLRSNIIFDNNGVVSYLKDNLYLNNKEKYELSDEYLNVYPPIKLK